MNGPKLNTPELVLIIFGKNNTSAAAADQDHEAQLNLFISFNRKYASLIQKHS